MGNEILYVKRGGETVKSNRKNRMLKISKRIIKSKNEILFLSLFRIMLWGTYFVHANIL